jgi:TPR repeat protein
VAACLADSESTVREAGFALLLRASELDLTSRLNVGIAYVLGQGVTKNVAKGVELLGRLKERADLPVNIFEQVRLVLGDVAAGYHGGDRDGPLAVTLWLEAGEYGHAGLFKAGEMAAAEGRFAFAAQAYHRAAAAGSAMAAFQLALMMLDGETYGDAAIVENLLQIASISGISEASDILGNDDVVRQRMSILSAADGRSPQ